MEKKKKKKKKHKKRRSTDMGESPPARTAVRKPLKIVIQYIEIFLSVPLGPFSLPFPFLWWFT